MRLLPTKWDKGILKIICLNLLRPLGECILGQQSLKLDWGTIAIRTSESGFP
jgi:hypothetical protein